LKRTYKEPNTAAFRTPIRLRFMGPEVADVGRERNQHPLDVDTKRVYNIDDEIHMG